jgi:hypothetical protein
MVSKFSSIDVHRPGSHATGSTFHNTATNFATGSVVSRQSDTVYELVRSRRIIRSLIERDEASRHESLDPAAIAAASALVRVRQQARLTTMEDGPTAKERWHARHLRRHHLEKERLCDNQGIEPDNGERSGMSRHETLSVSDCCPSEEWSESNTSLALANNSMRMADNANESNSPSIVDSQNSDHQHPNQACESLSSLSHCSVHLDRRSSTATLDRSNSATLTTIGTTTVTTVLPRVAVPEGERSGVVESSNAETSGSHFDASSGGKESASGSTQDSSLSNSPNSLVDPSSVGDDSIAAVDSKSSSDSGASGSRSYSETTASRESELSSNSIIDETVVEGATVSIHEVSSRDALLASDDSGTIRTDDADPSAMATIQTYIDMFVTAELPVKRIDAVVERQSAPSLVSSESVDTTDIDPETLERVRGYIDALSFSSSYRSKEEDCDQRKDVQVMDVDNSGTDPTLNPAFASRAADKENSGNLGCVMSMDARPAESPSSSPPSTLSNCGSVVASEHDEQLAGRAMRNEVALNGNVVGSLHGEQLADSDMQNEVTLHEVGNSKQKHSIDPPSMNRPIQSDCFPLKSDPPSAHSSVQTSSTKSDTRCPDPEKPKRSTASGRRDKDSLLESELQDGTVSTVRDDSRASSLLTLQEDRDVVSNGVAGINLPFASTNRELLVRIPPDTDQVVSKAYCLLAQTSCPSDSDLASFTEFLGFSYPCLVKGPRATEVSSVMSFAKELSISLAVVDRLLDANEAMRNQSDAHELALALPESDDAGKLGFLVRLIRHFEVQEEPLDCPPSRTMERSVTENSSEETVEVEMNDGYANQEYAPNPDDEPWWKVASRLDGPPIELEMLENNPVEPLRVESTTTSPPSATPLETSSLEEENKGRWKQRESSVELGDFSMEKEAATDSARAVRAFQSPNRGSISKKLTMVEKHRDCEILRRWHSRQKVVTLPSSPKMIYAVACVLGLPRRKKFSFGSTTGPNTWRLRYSERTESHSGFIDIDVHSLYSASSVHRRPHTLDVAPWESRAVKQRFLHEQSLATRNWFGCLTTTRGNKKVKEPVCRPKSMEMPMQIGEWTEEWFKQPRVIPVGMSNLYDDGLSDDDSWEKAPECGKIKNVRLRIGERISRVTPDLTSSLRRSRWRKKHFPQGTFPYK